MHARERAYVGDVPGRVLRVVRDGRLVHRGAEKLFEVRDYRQISGVYDAVVSIEMLEAVGHEYFDAFFSKCNELLAPNGLMALQVITCPEARYESVRGGVDFIQKHIFPGGLIPSVGARR